MSSELDSLLDLINVGMKGVKASLGEASLPPLNDPEIPSAIADPNYMQSAHLVIAAASRLIAALQHPFASVQEASGGMYSSALLNVVVEANITEALKGAGPQGLHARDLAEKVGMEPGLLARCLRYLSARHIYREISPNVFTNNRLSITLDTGLPFDQVKSRDPSRYDQATGVAALIGHSTDEGLKGAAKISETLLNTKTPLVPNQAPVMQAVGFENGTCFEWFEQPGNEKRLQRFSSAMKSLTAFFPAQLMLAAYDWDTLPAGSVVVDVGGGVGGATMPLAKHFNSLRFVVQDRAPVIAEGEKYWKTELPDALDSKLVELQAHDFFKPQPVKDATLFILRFILHDWPNTQALQILQNLREAATPSTRLMVLEQIVPYTSPVEDEIVNTIPGAAPPKWPEALQGNGGFATCTTFTSDIQMLNMIAAQDRTMGEWHELIESAGWKLERIKRGLLSSIICVPV